MVNLRQQSRRILYVTPLWPPCGSRQRSLQIIDALQQVGTVDLAVIDKGNTDRSLIELANANVDAEYAAQQISRTHEGWVRKFLRKVNPRSNYPNGWYVPNPADHHLAERVDSYDLIWFFQLYSAEYFTYRMWPKSVLDIDDVPSRYESSGLQTVHGLAGRASTAFRAWAWKRRERLLSNRFTTFTVCSDGDRKYLNELGIRRQVHVVPNGFRVPTVEPARNVATPPRIGFIGHFSHYPNYDGIQWFLNKCWARVKSNVPDARLRIVGPGSAGSLPPAMEGVDELGLLDNPSEEISTWSVMIVPIRIGGGTRVKIAEGFSQKCPIVSTALGAYGYMAQNGQHMYVADSPESFAEACVQAINQPTAAAQMAERAWEDFLARWSWDAIRPQVWAAAEDCFRRQRSGH